MPEPGKSDRWNSLLENLGVPVGESPPTAESPSSPPPSPAVEKRQPASLLPLAKAKGAAKPKGPPAAPKTTSYWSRIAGALGLEVPAEPEPPPAPEPPQARAPQVAAAAPPPRRAVDRPEIQRPEPVPRSEAPREAAPRESLRREPPRREDRDDDLPSRAFERRDRPAPPRAFEAPRPAPPRPAPPRAVEPSPSSALDDMFSSPHEDLDVFDLDSPENAPKVRAGDPARSRGDDAGPVLAYDAGDDSDLSLDRSLESEGEPREDAAREGEPSEGDGTRRRRRRRGRGRRGRTEERSALLPPQRAQDDEPARDDDDEDPELDRELDLNADDDLRNLGRGQRSEALRGGEDRPPRGQRPERGDRGDRSEYGARAPRGERADRLPLDKEREDYVPEAERAAGDEGDERGRRRRRGRGRGERDRDETRTERGAGPAAAAADEPYLAERRPPRPAPARADDDAEDLDLQLDLDEADDEGVGGLPTHKKIPTWEDAVGTLIEANMAARSSGPDRDRDRGRGGRGRGRGYGRGR